MTTHDTATHSIADDMDAILDEDLFGFEEDDVEMSTSPCIVPSIVPSIVPAAVPKLDFFELGLHHIGRGVSVDIKDLSITLEIDGNLGDAGAAGADGHAGATGHAGRALAIRVAWRNAAQELKSPTKAVFKGAVFDALKPMVCAAIEVFNQDVTKVITTRYLSQMCTNPHPDPHLTSVDKQAFDQAMAIAKVRNLKGANLKNALLESVNANQRTRWSQWFKYQQMLTRKFRAVDSMLAIKFTNEFASMYENRQSNQPLVARMLAWEHYTPFFRSMCDTGDTSFGKERVLSSLFGIYYESVLLDGSAELYNKRNKGAIREEMLELERVFRVEFPLLFGSME